jgi:hypothetical protein
MNDTLGCRLAKRTHSLREFVPSNRRIILLYSDKNFLHCRAECRTQRRVPLIPPHILTGSLDG